MYLSPLSVKYFKLASIWIIIINSSIPFYYCHAHCWVLHCIMSTVVNLYYYVGRYSHNLDAKNSTDIPEKPPQPRPGGRTEEAKQ